MADKPPHPSPASRGGGWSEESRNRSQGSLAAGVRAFWKWGLGRSWDDFWMWWGSAQRKVLRVTRHTQEMAWLQNSQL